ncbi:two-component regulator propeller domain-containing protein [Bacteroidota bacterium]
MYSQSIYFKQISVEQGLSGNRVYSIYKDSRGYMWFGTNIGVNRFDGYNFKYYEVDYNDTSSLSNPVVHSIIEDRSGNIWFGTERGLNKLNRINDKITRYLADKNDSLSLTNDNIRAIYEDTTGILWIGTYGGGLNKFDPEKGLVKCYSSNQNNGNSILSNRINNFYVDSEQNFWIATEIGGLSYFNRKKEQFTNYLPNENDKHSINEIVINSVIEDKEGNIWIGTWNGGLNLYNKETNMFYQFLNQLEEDNALNINIIRYIQEDNFNNIWLASFGNGIVKFNINSHKYENYLHNETNPNSLSSNITWTLLYDNEDNLWIGTFGGGISKCNLKRNPFSNINEKMKGTGLSHTSVTAIYEDNVGVIWIGTAGGGLNIYNPKTDQLSVYFNDNSTNSYIRDIYYGRSGFIWIGTDNGVYKYNIELHQFDWYGFFSENPKSLTRNAVYSIYEDKENTIWFAVWGEGLASLEFKEWNDKPPNDAIFKKYLPESKGVKVNKVWKIDKVFNEILIASDIGVAKYNREKDKFDYFFHYPSNCFISGKEGVLWIGTSSNGLISYNLNNDSTYLFNSEFGLSNNAINGLIHDNLGNMWISTEYGLNCFNTNTKNVTNYYKSNGLLCNEFNINAYTNLSNGYIAFGGNDGMIFFNPDDDIEKDTVTPSIEIIDFKIFNKSVDPFNREGIRIPIDECDNIKLTYYDKVFSFEFVALTYYSQDKCKYAYMLEGFDENWIYTDASNRKATYTNIKKGNFVFKAKASNSKGNWSETSKNIDIFITPPFWDTNVFKSFVIIFLIVFVFLYVYYRIKKISNQKQKFENLVHQRTKEISKLNEELKEQAKNLKEYNDLLEERQNEIESQAEELTHQNKEFERLNKYLSEVNATKDKFFSIIAHDLKNPFSIILGMCELISTNYKEMKEEERMEMVSMIQLTSQNLFSLLENLLEWSRTQRGLIKYSPKKLDLIQIINHNISIQKNQALSKNIDLIQNINEKEILINADEDMLDTIFRNLINNAIKFTPNNGKIEILVKSSDSKLHITVIDNGIGISKENINQLFRIEKNLIAAGTENEKGTGLGLIIVKEFAKMHKGEIKVESEIGKGSKFIVTIPFTKN